MIMDDGGKATQDWAQCKTCKRSFLPKALESHSKICSKLSSKKRKTFDSRRQRSEGTDVPATKAKYESAVFTEKAESSKKPTNWRKTHEDFIATIRAAKAISKIIKEGKPLPPPPPPTINPDHIQCPYCERRFCETAAERHIKFCQEKSSRMPAKGNFEDTKRVQVRTQYKPPVPVKKTSPAVSTALSASSRLPQRSGSGQSTAASSCSFSSAGPLRKTPTGLTSSSSNVDTKMRTVGSAKNAHSRIEMNKKKVETHMPQNDVNGGNEVDNGKMKGKFCYKCGSKYPVESAKFCCECGLKRMHM